MSGGGVDGAAGREAPFWFVAIPDRLVATVRIREVPLRAAGVSLR
jgi:hypothetical protein